MKIELEIPDGAQLLELKSGANSDFFARLQKSDGTTWAGLGNDFQSAITGALANRAPGPVVFIGRSAVHRVAPLTNPKTVGLGLSLNLPALHGVLKNDK